jgi:hypothetical protein
MTTAEKKQRNREYYLKNRERILSQAKARKSQKRQTHLEIVPPLKIENAEAVTSTEAVSDSEEHFQPVTRALKEVFQTSECMPGVRTETSEFTFNMQFELTPMERSLKLARELGDEPRAVTESVKNSSNGMPGKLNVFFGKIPISFVLRLLLVAGLTILMTAMQVVFYREHDILPGNAVPLALASELAFLSLVTIKFRRKLEWIRIGVHLIFFVYFISALSFHVYAKSRAKAASEPTFKPSETTEIKEQLKQAERSLEVATKGRAWKSMEVFGAEVSRLRKQISEGPKDLVLGTSSDQTLWIEAILLILLRALLLAASALNMLKLRDQTSEMTQCDGPPLQRKLISMDA